MLGLEMFLFLWRLRKATAFGTVCLAAVEPAGVPLLCAAERLRASAAPRVRSGQPQPAPNADPFSGHISLPDSLYSQNGVTAPRAVAETSVGSQIRALSKCVSCVEMSELVRSRYRERPLGLVRTHCDKCPRFLIILQIRFTEQFDLVVFHFLMTDVKQKEVTWCCC